MNKIIWNTQTLKRIEQIDGSKKQITFKTLSELADNKDNFCRIQKIRESKGRAKIETILI